MENTNVSTLNEEEIKKQKKETFKTRLRTALTFVVTWLAIYIVLDFLSAKSWLPAFSNNVRLAMNLINMVLLVPVLYFSIKEVCDLCFPKNKKILIAFAITTFVLFVGLSLYLLFALPNKNGMISRSIGADNAFAYYVIIMGSITLVTMIPCFIVPTVKIKNHTLMDKKVLFTFPLLTTLVVMFVNAFFYVTIVHTWTTCILLTLIPILADVFAYLSGLAIGKHKMCPKISPKKTWEGLIGSILITTLLMCGIYGLFFLDKYDSVHGSLYAFLGCQTCPQYKPAGVLINRQPYFWAIYVLVTMLLIGISTCGDLFFSYVKRRFEIKDFSNLLPGHGGMLDRIDSWIFVFVFYFIITIILQLACNGGGINILWNAL